MSLADFRSAALERANLEHVLVIPTFFQGRMAEYKPHRFFARKQAFLILHDQVISVDIVGIRRPAGNLAIHKATAALLALVDGEIPRMRLVGIRLF